MMNIWVEDQSGRSHKFDRFVEHSRRGGLIVAKWLEEDGWHSADIGWDEWDIALEASYPVVPAPPGYFVVLDGENEHGAFQPELSIAVALRLAPYCVIPIPMKVLPPNGGWGLLRPDNKVETREFVSDSLEEYVAFRMSELADERRHAEWRARRHEAAAGTAA